MKERAGARQVQNFHSAPVRIHDPWDGVGREWSHGSACRNVLLLCAVPRVLVLLEAVGLPNAYRIWYARSVRETEKVPTPAGTWEVLLGWDCCGMLI